MSVAESLRAIVRRLCDDDMAGRAPGTSGGIAAREFVAEQFESIGGLTPVIHQDIGGGGANLITSLEGTGDGYVILAAHYDHLGELCGTVYPGANDNAAAVAVMLETARALAAGQERPERTILFCAFDAEEPPYFLTPQMGSQWFVDHPIVPLDEIDLMVCLDLVGTALGPPELPAEVRETIFVQGAETSTGTVDLIDGLPTVPGIRPRHIPDWVIPPMSDHHAFRAARIPWVFYSVGRNAHYHAPSDTPEHLDYDKMAALAGHLEFLVAGAARRDHQAEYLDEPAGDDRTLETLRSILEPLAGSDGRAVEALGIVQALVPSITDGRLTANDRSIVRAMVTDMEQRLSG